MIEKSKIYVCEDILEGDKKAVLEKVIKLTRIIVNAQIEDPSMFVDGKKRQIVWNLYHSHGILRVFDELKKSLQKYGTITQSDQELELIYVDKKDGRSVGTVDFDRFETVSDLKNFDYQFSSKDYIKKAEEEAAKYKVNFVLGSASTKSIFALKVGEMIGKKGFGCIIGGDGKVEDNAMREAYNNAAKNGTPCLIVISTQHLMEKQGIDDFKKEPNFVLIMPNMIERIGQMYKMADYFTALRGGMGTVEEVLILIKLNLESGLNKPIFVINEEGIWTKLKDLLIVLGLGDQVQFFDDFESYKEAVLKQQSIDNN